MHIGIICKVIDNFGDAGFSLRLAKALTKTGHSVDLFHDHSATFAAIYPTHDIDTLRLIDATRVAFEKSMAKVPDLILEPFGTSSEQTGFRFDVILKREYPCAPWLLIDYLSSEKWIENFHLSTSVDPGTGHISTFFYPGFTEKTGGLIHCDFPSHLLDQQQPATPTLRLFVFAYSNAPVRKLIDACNSMNKQGNTVEIGLVRNGLEISKEDCAKVLPFVPQSQFDELLSRYDVLFVRGEDSFVRAQLAGKPFIWQIYPTEDNAHAEKLTCFYELYAEALNADCKMALWNCWLAWNGMKGGADFSETWVELVPYLPDLRIHALKWQTRLFNGRELVKEVLTWRGLQTPTLPEKPDL